MTEIDTGLTKPAPINLRLLSFGSIDYRFGCAGWRVGELLMRSVWAAGVLFLMMQLCVAIVGPFGPDKAWALTAAEQKQLYARCKAKYGRVPKSITIRSGTVVCEYDAVTANVSEEQARSECVKLYGPSVAPFVRKRNGKWVCTVSW